MNCDDIRALYLDRDFDISGLEAGARIAAHLGQCQACRQAAEQYDALRSVLKISPGDEPLDLDDARLPLNDLEAPKPVPSRRRGAAILVGRGALAALILLALLGWGLYFTHRLEKPPQTAADLAAGGDTKRMPGLVVPASLHWTPAEVHRGVTVFKQVSESFEGRAGWVAVGDRASDVGLIDGPASSPPKVLLLRLLMSAGDRPPSKTDLVIVPGQEVHVELPFQSGETLRYRIKTVPGTKLRLTLAAEVCSLDHSETLAALATQLQPQDGEALSAGRLSSQSGPYNLDVSFSETALSSIQ